MGLLDGGIAALFGAVFGPLYLDETLYRDTLTGDGMGGGSVASTSQPCKVQQDVCTEQMRETAGYTEKDVRLLILQYGVTGGVNSDCRVTSKGVTYRVSNPITQDPGASYWECRGTPA